MGRSIALGILAATPAVFVLFAPITGLSSRGSALRPTAYLLALVASGALSRFVFRHDSLVKWASRWRVLFGSQRS